MPDGPAAILELQRAIGNRAVTRLLARQPAPDVDDEPVGAFDVKWLWQITADLAEARGRKDWAKYARLLAALGQGAVLALLKDFPDKQLAAIDAAAKPLPAAKREALHRQISFLRRRIPDVKAQRGVAVHDPGRQDVSVTVDGGAVEARVKVAYRDLEDLTDDSDVIAGFSLSYTGRDAARAHWIQFVWREIIFERPGQKPKPLGGTYKTDSGTWPLTTDETKPLWHVDSVSETVPFYEATGDHNTSAGNITVFDDPGAAQAAIRPHMKGRDQPTRVISRVHFASYLVRDMDVLHRIDTNIEWIFDGTTLTSKTGAAESKGSPGGLDKVHLAALRQQYPKFDYFPEAVAKAPAAAPEPAKTK